MWNNDNAAVAAAHSVDRDRWQQAFSEVIDRIAPRFARYEALRHAAGLIQGLVSGLNRKNHWTIAEHRGQATPDGLQHLLARAKWDADAVRDDLRTATRTLDSLLNWSRRRRHQHRARQSHYRRRENQMITIYGCPLGGLLSMHPVQAAQAT
ncbi:MAG: hypothetical protein ACR2KG_12020 [Nocardioidaceae bacterium]